MPHRGVSGDRAMTFRKVAPDEILAVLRDGGDDPVLRTCVAALRAHSRPRYTIGGSPANVLRETLEVKYGLAASHGKSFVGKDAAAAAVLLLQLHELGSILSPLCRRIMGGNFCIYLKPSTLKPVAIAMPFGIHRQRVVPRMTGNL
jgi:hypothetical protein